MSSSRQLAAIMFTDIVGYTALMSKDEDKAFQSLAQFKKIAQPLVEKFQGRWHKDLGDGALMSFSNVLDAVHCAITIQKEINVKEDFKLRMGIHLGDITFKDGDVFGDGVNISSRLQNEASAGGICISEPVFKNIQNQEGIGTQYMGKKKLKNVSEPLRLYQIKVEGIQTTAIKKSWTISWPLAGGLIITASLLTGILMNNMQSGMRSNEITSDTIKTVSRTLLEFPEEAPLALIGSAPSSIGQTALALSPDGSHLVYVAQVDSLTTRLYLHPMNGFSFSAMPGTEGAYYPFFSPDGKWVGFFADKKMKKISINGGTPVILCDVSIPIGAFWNKDDRIIFANNEAQRMMWVSSNGGKPQEVFENNRRPNVDWHGFPSPLPGQDNMVFREHEFLFVSSLTSGKTKNLRINGNSPKYIPSGHLVYADNGRLFAVRFNHNNLEIESSPFPIIESIRTEIMARASQMCFADNGTMIYISGSAADLSTFIWSDRNGHTEAVAAKADQYGMFTLSPDGNKIAYGKWMSDSRIGIIDLRENQVTEIPTEYWDMEPVWSPDGQWIAYISKDKEKHRINRIRIGRMNKPETLLESDDFIRPYAYLRDGKSISCFRFGGAGADIENLALDSSGKMHTLVGAMPYACYGASFSPDQRYFVYNADESGRYEIYVQPYPPTGERWQISTEGGFDGIWSPKGNEIFYRTPDQLFTVAVKTDSGFSFKKPGVIFRGQFLDAPQRSFDVSPDGQRFLMLRPVNKERIARRAIVITNWFEEVKKLTPSN